MKEIKVERTVFDTKYEAIDGEIFNSREECQKYEESAQTVLTQKYNKLVVVTTDEYAITRFGSDDECVEIVKVNSVKDCDIVKQMYVMINHLTDKDLQDYQKKELEAVDKAVDKALNTKDLLIIGRGYEPNYCFWIVGTKTEFVDHILNKFAKYEEPELNGGGC